MMRAVDDVLEEIGAGASPRLLVLNKIDLLDDEERRMLELRHRDAVLVSAVDGRGTRRAPAADRGARSATALEAVELLVPFERGARASRSCTRSPATSSARTRPRAFGCARACPAGVAARLRAVRAERPTRAASGLERPVPAPVPQAARAARARPRARRRLRPARGRARAPRARASARASAPASRSRSRRVTPGWCCRARASRPGTASRSSTRRA